MSMNTEVLDAVVVGGGLAGMYAVYALRERGASVHGFEAAAGFGGTWYHNRYPGARCDIESVDYSFSFSEELQQEWDWSERFATQPEILAYLEHVAARFDLAKNFSFETKVTGTEYREHDQRWQIRTDTGREISARFCIFATGPLSATNLPNIKGRDDFEGNSYHTGAWPHGGVDFRGKRVGVIGTGSSGIQSVPEIAEDADQLFVFQRSANYTIPAGNRALSDELKKDIKANYSERRRQARASGGGSPFTPYPKSALEVDDIERRRVYDEWWERGGVLFSKAFPDQLSDRAANDTARIYTEEKIRQIVRDEAIAAALTPTDHPIGTKRIVTDTGYYETFNRDNVTLVDLRKGPIEQITARGIQTSEAHYDLDIIVYATGFDAMTGALDRIDIRGKGGLRLTERWADGPQTYLGLGVDGFPNMFIVTGPGSPSVLANMVLASEQHVDWILSCLEYLDSHGLATVEATSEAVDCWVAECNERASKTLFPQANSWYMGANIPGKPRVFMPFIGGFKVYGDILDEVRDAEFRGFSFESAGAAITAAGVESSGVR